MPPAEWRELAFRGLSHLTPREFGGATRAWAAAVWGSQNRLTRIQGRRAAIVDVLTVAGQIEMRRGSGLVAAPAHGAILGTCRIGLKVRQSA